MADEDPLDDVASALRDIAGALDRLGNADADTSLGGLEALGRAIIEAAHIIAAAKAGNYDDAILAQLGE